MMGATASGSNREQVAASGQRSKGDLAKSILSHQDVLCFGDALITLLRHFWEGCSQGTLPSSIVHESWGAAWLRLRFWISRPHSPLHCRTSDPVLAGLVIEHVFLEWPRSGHTVRTMSKTCQLDAARKLACDQFIHHLGSVACTGGRVPSRQQLGEQRKW